MYALILNGLVTEITDVDPAGRFHPSLKWVACSDDVELGWLYQDNIFSPPVLEKDEAAIRITAIQVRLSEIDTLTLRPLRAILAKTDTAYDQVKLKELEDEAEALREELRVLKGTE